MTYASLLHVKMLQLCILLTLRPKVWATEDDTNISVMGCVAACAGGQLGVAQPCRSRADRRAGLAQVPLRALPCRHPQLLPCRPLRRIPLRLPPTGRDPAPGSTCMLFPNAWGKSPRHSFPKPLFPAAWSGWHYGKADHEHRQPNLQGMGGRRGCRAH